jgi:hypothetical protein
LQRTIFDRVFKWHRNERHSMKPFLLVMGFVCFTVPTFAGEAHKSDKIQAAQPLSPLASDDARQRRAPAVKTGGLLNTDVTQAQAKRVAEQTNRQILRRESQRKSR